jgi:zinc transporter ZupT
MKTKVLTAVTGLLGAMSCVALLLQNNILLSICAAFNAALLLAVTIGGAIEIQRKSREKADSKVRSQDIAAHSSCL